MSDRFFERRERLRRAVRKEHADAVLVTDATNVTYLTGFTGDDSFLVVRGDGDTLISDGRYTIQLDEECPTLDRWIRAPGFPIHKAVAKVLTQAKIRRLAIESAWISVQLRDAIAGELPNLEWHSTSNLVERLRWTKDASEVAQIRQAVRLAERSFEVLQATLCGDKTEKRVADELEHQMRLFGAKGAAFASIVATGPRAALPHAHPGGHRVDSGSILLVDWGADGGLYKSDLTRILVTGRISPEIEKVYGVVLKAQLKAIAAIRPGVPVDRVDRVARTVIDKAGYGQYFGHGLGHGLGLQVHEEPRMNPTSQMILEAGMVVTVEPGVYLPGRFGIRIEDDVLVTRDGHEVLSRLPKQFDEVVALSERYT